MSMSSVQRKSLGECDLNLGDIAHVVRDGAGTNVRTHVVGLFHSDNKILCAVLNRFTNLWDAFRHKK